MLYTFVDVSKTHIYLIKVKEYGSCIKTKRTFATDA